MTRVVPPTALPPALAHLRGEIPLVERVSVDGPPRGAMNAPPASPAAQAPPPLRLGYVSPQEAPSLPEDLICGRDRAAAARQNDDPGH
jgi:hypothetical protein